MKPIFKIVYGIGVISLLFGFYFAFWDLFISETLNLNVPLISPIAFWSKRILGLVFAIIGGICIFIIQRYADISIEDKKRLGV